MRSFEIIAPEANRPASRLQPKRRGTASVQKDSEGIPGDPDAVVAQVNRFGFVGRRFKLSIHSCVPGVEFSRNYRSWLFASPRLIGFEAPKADSGDRRQGGGGEEPR